MNYQIDHSAPQSAYLQLYTLLRRDILAGIYPYGSRLPSKRTIAAETGVSVITVEHAVALLCEEGYAEARQRSGVFVAYRERDFQGQPAGTAQSPLPGDVLRHSDSEFPFALLARTVRRVLLDYGDAILARSPNPGCVELRRAICAYLARSRGIQVDPEQLVIGSGAEYLYGLIAQLFPQRVFALEDPCYDKIRQVYAANGLRCERLRLGREGIDSAALEGSGAEVLHVTPFHSFPSGVTASVSKKHEYLRWAEGRGAWLVEDNFDSELTVSRKAEEPLFSMSRSENVIYINTFSKTVSPGLRVGYMILPKSLVGVFSAQLGFYACTVPLMEQYVLTELIESGDFERHINRIRRARRRDG